ncbi:MAG: TIGR01906 family membrane protein [Chloroflexi bacterium]|nr:TIGR01906 family membrane protein [Chloroflexota bacterium]MYC00343.1 TIGR01906 family membrane protein [Chloroflexota bacterium]
MNPIAQHSSLRLGRALAEVALAVALFTLPVAFSVRYATTSASWWERGFERHDATGRTGLSQAEVLRVAEETRDYLTNDDERLDVDVAGEPFYTEREVLHMIDVKRLMARTFDAGWAALGFIIAFVAVIVWRRRREAPTALARSTLFACGVVALLVVVLGIIGINGFDSAFRQFHLLFFTNDLWQLSPRDGLIQLFPQRFFFDTTLLIGGVTLAFVVAAGAGSAIYLWRRRRRSWFARGQDSGAS